jgi:hypothetical protein
MLRISHIFAHPIEASRIFWRAFTGKETGADPIKLEETKLGVLRVAIGLYRESFGRLPEKLQDLCFNNHNDATWSGPFIRWVGDDTFNDTFGYPYRYAVSEGRFELVSPGLKRATR